MTSKRRLWIAGLLTSAVTALLLLGTAISQIELRQGYRLSNGTFGDSFRLPPGASSVTINPSVIQLLIFLAMVFFIPAGVLLLVRDKESRKRFLQQALILSIVVALFLFISQRADEEMRELAELQGQGDGIGGPEILELDPTKFFTDPPTWLTLLVSALVVSIMAYTGYRWWKAANKVDDLDKIAKEARSALSSLESGYDLRDTILRCYHDMTIILNRTRGFQRDPGMTPREFETRLQSAGLPHEAVTRLTRLFETVRYGSSSPGEQAESDAVESLKVIIAACEGSNL